MKLVSYIAAVLHLLNLGTASPAPPLLPRFPCGGSGCTPPQTEYAIQNASMALGWQLAGVMADKLQVYGACKDIQALSHGKWHEVGLDGFTVQGTLPTWLNTRRCLPLG